MEPLYKALSQKWYKSNLNMFQFYLLICLYDIGALILHHFYCYCLHVLHPQAFCNLAEGALPQERLHQVVGGSGGEPVSGH